MRPRYEVLAALVLSCSLGSFVALAQTKRPSKAAPQRGPRVKGGKPSKLDKATPRTEAGGTLDPATPVGNDGKPPPSGASGASSPSTDDLGEPPPRPAATRAGGIEIKPSPLNPEANEFADGGTRAPPVEYDRLLADMATLQSRVSALTTTLYASKLRVVVEIKGDDAQVTGFNVSLDDGVVFSAPPSFAADSERTVYEHSVAPGHHVLGVEVERVDARNKEYRTLQTSRFSLVVPENKRLDAHLSVQDDSDMAKDFPADQDGEYDLRVHVRARVAP